MPDWVDTASYEYFNRLKSYCKIQITTLPLAHRSKNTNPQESKKLEGQSMLAKISPGDHVVALDAKGKQLCSENFAEFIDKLKGHAKNIHILIGGPDGLSPECLARANDQISLSKLTLPHPIVRIVLAEQLYRAFTILNNHPYHK